MNNALWLLLVVPQWYFQSARAFIGEPDPLTSVPCLGAGALAAGLLLGIFRRDGTLFWALVPFLLTELLVAVAGFFRGGLPQGVGPLLLAFLFLVALVAGWTFYRARHSRLAASLLGLFGISYALFGAFVAGMAFSDNWL